MTAPSFGATFGFPVPDPAGIPPADPFRPSREEPIFWQMVADWGCPLVGVPWTGRRPTWGGVVVRLADSVRALVVASDPGATGPVPLVAADVENVEDRVKDQVEEEK